MDILIGAVVALVLYLGGNRLWRAFLSSTKSVELAELAKLKRSKNEKINTATDAYNDYKRKLRVYTSKRNSAKRGADDSMESGDGVRGNANTMRPARRPTKASTRVSGGSNKSARKSTATSGKRK